MNTQLEWDLYVRSNIRIRRIYQDLKQNDQSIRQLKTTMNQLQYKFVKDGKLIYRCFRNGISKRIGKKFQERRELLLVLKKEQKRFFNGDRSYDVETLI